MTTPALVKSKLLVIGSHPDLFGAVSEWCQKAADEIDRLNSEINESRNGALREAADIAHGRWEESQGPFGSHSASVIAHEIETSIRSLITEGDQ